MVKIRYFKYIYNVSSLNINNISIFIRYNS